MQNRLLTMLFCLTTSPLFAADDSGFTLLFNGKDLAGWTSCSVAPETFFVRDGMLVTTGQPIGLLRTVRMYENFVADFEWRHLKSGGNSGFFIWADGLPFIGSPFPRGIEVQILDPGFNVPGKNQWYSTHGDIFAANGSKLTVAGRISPDGRRSFPSEERTKPSPEWNHYRVTAVNGDIRLCVNGKEVTTAKAASPRKGYLMFEAEGSEAHFRNVRIRELPSTNPRPEEIADAAEGYTSLFTGLDFRGWKTPRNDAAPWKVRDGSLHYEGPGDSDAAVLVGERTLRDFQLIADWIVHPSPVGRAVTQPAVGIGLRGRDDCRVHIHGGDAKPGSLAGIVEAAAQDAAGKPAKNGWNRFEITVRGNTVRVVLNGRTVLRDTTVPGLPSQGPIRLDHRAASTGDKSPLAARVEFRNIFVRELKP